MSEPSDAAVYIAAPFNRKLYVRMVASILITKGYRPVVRWLDAPDNDDLSVGDQQLASEAITDLTDIEKCDLFVLCNGPGFTSTTGGMHNETGYALHAGKKCVILGERTPGNPFHRLMDTYDSPEAIPGPHELGF